MEERYCEWCGWPLDPEWATNRNVKFCDECKRTAKLQRCRERQKERHTAMRKRFPPMPRGHNAGLTDLTWDDVALFESTAERVGMSYTHALCEAGIFSAWLTRATTKLTECGVAHVSVVAKERLYVWLNEKNNAS